MSPGDETEERCRWLRARYPVPAEKPGVVAGVSGWNSENNLRLFETLVPRNASVIVELGCWLGQGTLELLRVAPHAQVICVDHWGGSPEHQNHTYYRRLLPTLYNRFLVNTWDYRDRVIPVKEPTGNGLRAIAECGIRPAFVYVDASHEYPDVKHDVELSMQLFPNAVIAGDDYDWDGVHEALADLGLGERTRNDGKCWWLVR